MSAVFMKIASADRCAVDVEGIVSKSLRGAGPYSAVGSRKHYPYLAVAQSLVINGMYRIIMLVYVVKACFRTEPYMRMFFSLGNTIDVIAQDRIGPDYIEPGIGVSEWRTKYAQFITVVTALSATFRRIPHISLAVL